MVIVGTVSIFGGKDDKGMVNDTGLALYEPWEANQRPDLFYPAPPNEPNQPTWKRLIPESFYCALMYGKRLPRRLLKEAKISIFNIQIQEFVEAHLVDKGPALWTKRLIDVSPGVASWLHLKTDDVVRIECSVELFQDG